MEAGEELICLDNYLSGRNQTLQCEPLTLYGDGSQTSGFCFVEDLIQGMIRLMNGANTKQINIGNPTEFTIRQLAELVRDQINLELKLFFQTVAARKSAATSARY